MVYTFVLYNSFDIFTLLYLRIFVETFFSVLRIFPCNSIFVLPLSLLLYPAVHRLLLWWFCLSQVLIGYRLGIDWRKVGSREINHRIKTNYRPKFAPIGSAMVGGGTILIRTESLTAISDFRSKKVTAISEIWQKSLNGLSDLVELTPLWKSKITFERGKIRFKCETRLPKSHLKWLFCVSNVIFNFTLCPQRPEFVAIYPFFNHDSTLVY